jgi:polyadenylation factor subunit 2
MKDRFHIGEEAAEAQGTWSRGFGRRQMREEEEQEMQDEAESLVDQRRPGPPTLPGIQAGGTPQPDGPGFLPGIGGAQPPPPPGLPGMGGMNPDRLAAIMSSQPPPPQSLPPPNQPIPGFPMIPGMGAAPPMNMDLAQLQKQLASQGFPMPPNMPMPPGFGGLPGLQGGGMPDGGRR